MPSMTLIAREFFEACEAGQGWEGCRAYCLPNATFAAQSEPFAEIRTLQAYTEWMKGLLSFMPDVAMRLNPSRPMPSATAYALMGCFRPPILARAVPVRRPAKARIPITST